MLFNSLCFCSLVLFLCSLQVQAEEERKVKLRKIVKVKEDEKDFKSSFQLSQPDAEGHMKISGDFKHHVTLDNDWKINITVYRSDSPDKDYVKFKDFPLLGTCELMSSFYKNYFYEKLKEYSNAPDPDNCPLPPQEYYLKDYPLDSSKYKKFLIPGYYQLISQLLQDKEVKLEYMIEVQVE